MRWWYIMRDGGSDVAEPRHPNQYHNYRDRFPYRLKKRDAI